jgi:hypothetical protein
MDQKKEIPLHFKGKQALEHVIAARMKGKAASAEMHGTELPGHYYAAADAAKETALILLILWTLLSELGLSLSAIHWISLSFMVGFLFWKTGRSAILGWARLERLHRLIEEERWEIEHHRPQEREELKALYAAKGFTGKLLEESIDTLMADDNRLLQVMLEEELGLQLESYEHPLKQAMGAFLAVLVSALLMAISLFFLPKSAPAFTASAIIIAASALVAHLEKNKPLNAIVWNLATAMGATAIAYFAAQIFLPR